MADKVDTQGIRVAVYGSLRNGLSNHVCLSEYGAELLGTHIMPEDSNYRMVSLGAFPAVFPADKESATPITIEVYRVTDECLLILDSLEGHPDWYKREKVSTPWKKAWMYVMPAETYDDHTPIETGDWVDHYTAQYA